MSQDKPNEYRVQVYDSQHGKFLPEKTLTQVELDELLKSGKNFKAAKVERNG